MSMSSSKVLLVAAVFAAGGITAAVAAGKADAPAKTAKAEAKAAASSIPYDELKYHVGERVVVETKFKSTRTGTLAKASQFELVLSVPTVSGPAELSMPKETIVRVTPAETPKPAKP
jgi:hypothetical protein